MYAGFEIGIKLYARVGISDEKGISQLLKCNMHHKHYSQPFLKLNTSLKLNLKKFTLFLTVMLFQTNRVQWG